MTDTPTPGSEWLLPVTIDEIDGYAWARTSVSENAAICIQTNDFPSLIPASRLADLEAEVARWQQLYEDARHDLTKAEMKVERLREALQAMVDEKCDYMLINHLGDPDGTHTVKHARAALNPKD